MSLLKTLLILVKMRGDRSKGKAVKLVHTKATEGSFDGLYEQGLGDKRPSGLLKRPTICKEVTGVRNLGFHPKTLGSNEGTKWLKIAARMTVPGVLWGQKKTEVNPCVWFGGSVTMVPVFSLLLALQQDRLRVVDLEQSSRKLNTTRSRSKID